MNDNKIKNIIDLSLTTMEVKYIKYDNREIFSKLMTEISLGNFITRIQNTGYHVLSVNIYKGE